MVQAGTSLTRKPSGPGGLLNCNDSGRDISSSTALFPSKLSFTVIQFLLPGSQKNFRPEQHLDVDKTVQAMAFLFPILFSIVLVIITSQQYMSWRRLSQFRGPFWASITNLWMAKGKRVIMSIGQRIGKRSSSCSK